MNTGWIKFAAPLAVVALLLGGLAMRPTPEAPSLMERTEFGIGYLKVNRLPDARQILLDVLAEDPKNFRANYGMGLVEMQAREFSKAERYLKQANALRPDDLEVLISLGALYQKGRAFKQAEAIFLAVLKKDPTN